MGLSKSKGSGSVELSVPLPLFVFFLKKKKPLRWGFADRYLELCTVPSTKPRHPAPVLSFSIYSSMFPSQEFTSLRPLQHILNPRKRQIFEIFLPLPERLLLRTRRRAVDGKLVAHHGLDGVLVLVLEVRLDESSDLGGGGVGYGFEGAF